MENLEVQLEHGAAAGRVDVLPVLVRWHSADYRPSVRLSVSPCRCFLPSDPVAPTQDDADEGQEAGAEGRR